MEAESFEYDEDQNRYIGYRPSSEIIVDRDGGSRYSELSGRKSSFDVSPVPGSSDDMDKEPADVQRYKSFSRPTIVRDTLRRESGEEIIVGYPRSPYAMSGNGNPYVYGR